MNLKEEGRSGHAGEDKLMYIMPVVSIPVMINFPAALNVYWLTNNVISLVQSRVVRQPAVRERLGIGEMIKWKPEDLPMNNFYVSVDKYIMKDYVREGFQLKKVKNDGNFHLGGGGLGHSISELLFFCMPSESSRNALKYFFHLAPPPSNLDFFLG